MSKDRGRTNEEPVAKKLSQDSDAEPPEGKQQVKFSRSTDEVSKPPLERVLTSGAPLTGYASRTTSDSDGEEDTENLKFSLGPSDSQQSVAADTNALSTRPAVRFPLTEEVAGLRRDGTSSREVDDAKLQKMRRNEGETLKQWNDDKSDNGTVGQNMKRREKHFLGRLASNRSQSDEEVDERELRDVNEVVRKEATTLPEHAYEDIDRSGLEPYREEMPVLAQKVPSEATLNRKTAVMKAKADAPDVQPIHIIVGHGSKAKQACTTATQVEDEELLAKTISTQVSEGELERLADMEKDEPQPPPTIITAKGKLNSPEKRAVAIEETVKVIEESKRPGETATVVREEAVRSEDGPAKHPQFSLTTDDDTSAASEKDDVVDNTLRPVASSAQLHGILRKIPSAKWMGSQSTVAFDEMQPNSRSSSIVGDDSGNHHSRGRTTSHNHVAFNEGHRKGSIGKKLSGMFHLGDRDDETSSNAGDAAHGNHHHHHRRLHLPHFGKHNGNKDHDTSDSSIDSTASRPQSDASILPLTSKKTVPWYRRLFTKKKTMTRSFTMDDLKQDLKMDDHLIPEKDLLARLDVNPETGLSADEAARRLVKDGKNMLTPPKKVPEILKFLHELIGGFSPLLEIGSILCFIAYGLQVGTQRDAPGDNLYLAIVLLCVVLITGGFLYLQKAKSEQIMEGFKNMIPQTAKVLRGSKQIEISAEDVVMGDIVELHGGDRIPADVRILESKGLKVDNASLTGESEAQSRSTESSENPLESKNLAFYTSNAVEGLGKAVVVRRGDATVMGRIAKLTTRIDTSETTIAREMRHFVILICIFAIVMGGIIFVVALCVGYGGLYAIILAIGLVVANVPEGIIITVTVMLTLTAKRMAKKNCLIKNLEAVETLGACSVICSDKTGTLTQNRMTVSHCWVDEEILTMDTISETDAGKNLLDTPTVKDLLQIATLCNRAKFKDDQGEKPIYQRECVGDASEIALLKFTEIVTGNVVAERQKNKAVAEIPFNSTNKYQVSIHETDNAGQKGYLLVMKGAPERIWDRCATVVSHGQNAPKDEEWTQKFQDAYTDLGSMGERVLGFALLPLPADKYPYPTQFDVESKDFPSEGLQFTGLISLIDPPRAAVPDGVAKCRSAGIQVIMVTGDHPLTAKAIARNVGIISATGETVEDIAQRKGVPVKDVDPREAQAIVIHGNDLRDMSAQQLDDVLKYHSEIVFARTSPQQKLMIVEACQRSGAIVAVTGDGVNDSPALKKANIGIAMGITGSDVSKQAADMVLLDDNFASIVTGIEEGRLIFDNLKKTICYTLMSNMPEIIPVLIYFILSVPVALTTIPMLLISLGTDMVPSISMAHESAEADIMKMPPRNPDDRLVSGKLIQCSYLQAGIICSTGAFFSYFVVLGSCGFRPYDVMGLRDRWEDASLDDLQDSYGQEWNYAQRMLLQRTVEAAFLAAVVVFQWFDLISRKVRRKSVFQKGMRNWFLNYSIVFETLIAVFCIYVPVLNYALHQNTIRFIWWLPVLPFAIYYFVFDELRRYLIRRYPGGWWENELYF